MDISRFINWFIGQVVLYAAYFFNLLASITFNGTNLLEFIFSLIVIGIVIDILIISVRSRRVETGKKAASGKGESNDSE